MNKKSPHEPPKKVDLKGRLAGFRKALEDEISEIEKSGQSSLLLNDGRKMEHGGKGHWYQFKVSYVPVMPADTPCKLVIGDTGYDVTVVSFDDDHIIVSSDNPLPETIAKAHLENGSTVLLERLIRCIETNAEMHNTLGDHMFTEAGAVYSAKEIHSYNDLKLDESYNIEQKQAIYSALSYDISYIWGPPGTGKTTVIGRLIDELYKHNRSVLLVSHTNTAVDAAITKADKALYKSYDEENASTPYPILRIGNPVKSLPDRLLLQNHIEKLGAELVAQLESLIDQKSKIEQKIAEAASVLAKNTWIQNTCISKIPELVQDIKKLDAAIRLFETKIDELKAEIKYQRSIHPRYNTYKESMNTLSLFYSQMENRVADRNKAVDYLGTLKTLMEKVQDEIKKHTLYAELQAKVNGHMSLSFLKGEIEKAESAIASLDTRIKELTTQCQKYQQEIDEYESRRAISRLFSGKKAIDKARINHSETSLRLTEMTLQRENLANLRNDYIQQCKQIEVLNAQMRALVPSKTVDYWQAELVRLEKQISDGSNRIAKINQEIEGIRSQISKLEVVVNEGRADFEYISSLEVKQQQAEDKLKKTQSLRRESYGFYLKYLEHEKALLQAFSYSLKTEDLIQCYLELSGLYSHVKSEVEKYDIEEVHSSKEAAETELTSIIQRENEIQAKLQELEKHAIVQAKIVGATLAKSYLSDILRQRKFDTVIIDEASMAPIPALWCASCLAENSLVIVGDFLQLPPIVLSNTPVAQKWLGKDVFFHSGIQKKAKDRRRSISNFTMLKGQYRMESDIAEVANMYYGVYGGLTTLQSVDRIPKRNEFYSWYAGKQTKDNIHLIDTESLHAWVTGVPQGKGHSRFNAISASIDVAIAFKLLEKRLGSIDAMTYQKDSDEEKEASVLIIAPYKPHIAYINQLIELEYKDRGFKPNEHPNSIRAGTIHSFQGAEADIVILDLVVDEPHWRANLFIQDGDANEDNRKLFNVAITRAKFKLYIVGNFAYCQKKSKKNALGELLDHLIVKKGLKKVDAKEALPNILFAKKAGFSSDAIQKDKVMACFSESFDELFEEDLRSFSESAIIFSPFMTKDRIAKYLPYFIDSVNQGKKIVVVTKDISERGEKKEHYRQCERELKAVGVKIVYKKGMHEKLVIFDDTAYWYGSLNVLSFSGETGELMTRFDDANMVMNIKKYMCTEQILEVLEQDEKVCPICQNELVMCESSEGGIYWKCYICQYTRNKNQPYPKDGILKCKCGAPYAFAMKTEPRWVCTQNPRHFTRVRKCDLKLDKMVSLIPLELRDQVNQFFKQGNEEGSTVQSESDQEENGGNGTTGTETYEQMSLF